MGTFKRKQSILLWGIHLFVQQIFTEHLLYPAHSFHLSTEPDRTSGIEVNKAGKRQGTCVHRTFISWKRHTINSQRYSNFRAFSPALSPALRTFILIIARLASHHHSGFSFNVTSSRRFLSWPLYLEEDRCHQLPIFVSLFHYRFIFFRVFISATRIYGHGVKDKVAAVEMENDRHTLDWGTQWSLWLTLSIHSIPSDQSKQNPGIPVPLAVTQEWT